LGLPRKDACACGANLSDRLKVVGAYKDLAAKLKRSRERMDKAVLANRTDLVTEATREVEDLGHQTEKARQAAQQVTDLVTAELDRFEAALERDLLSDTQLFKVTMRSTEAEVVALWEADARSSR